MAHKIFVSLTFLLLVLFLSGQSFAQQCETNLEVIEKLVEPDIGSYNLWQSELGNTEYQELFSGGFQTDARHVIAAGVRYKFKRGRKDLIVAEFDSRGRLERENVFELDGLVAVTGVLPHPDGFIVAANRRVEGRRLKGWIGFFDKQGQLVSEKIYEDLRSHIEITKVIPDPYGEGYLALAGLKPRGVGGIEYSALYRLSPAGEVLLTRAFQTGMNNRLSSIIPIDDGRLIAGGYTSSADGRRAGWLVKLTGDGGLMWQRQYPRGRGARIAAIAKLTDDFIVTVGESVPSDNGLHAAWVMTAEHLDGKIGWQRYYRSDFRLHGAGVMVSRDGLISVMMNAKKSPQKKADDEYVRILTLNPRGLVFESDEYFRGKGVSAMTMAPGGSGERFLFGQARVVHEVDSGEVDENGDPIMIDKKSPDAWALAGAPMEPYDDPCLQNFNFVP